MWCVSFSSAEVSSIHWSAGPSTRTCRRGDDPPCTGRPRPSWPLNTHRPSAARHLLLTEPAGDRKVATVLFSAARSALAEGSTEIVVAQLRRALAEPPPAERRLDILLALGTAESVVMDPAAWPVDRRKLLPRCRFWARRYPWSPAWSCWPHSRSWVP